MYYSYVEIEYIATSFYPARTDLALWQEIVFGVTFVLSVQYTCAVVLCQFLVVVGNSVVAGNSSQNENTF